MTPREFVQRGLYDGFFLVVWSDRVDRTLPWSGDACCAERSSSAFLVVPPAVALINDIKHVAEMRNHHPVSPNPDATLGHHGHGLKPRKLLHQRGLCQESSLIEFTYPGLLSSPSLLCLPSGCLSVLPPDLPRTRALLPLTRTPSRLSTSPSTVTFGWSSAQRPPWI